jgi:hypothetical protein
MGVALACTRAHCTDMKEEAQSCIEWQSQHERERREGREGGKEREVCASANCPTINLNSSSSSFLHFQWSILRIIVLVIQ